MRQRARSPAERANSRAVTATLSCPGQARASVADFAYGVGTRARAGTQGDTTCRFASLALGPGSRFARPGHESGALAPDTRMQQPGLAQPATLAAAALLVGLAPASWVGESSASSARLIVAWRVAEVIFAPNRSVM
jgi:hypothetical protein